MWEASVRATHHFLKEEDIAYFKPLILNIYLDAVQLKCVRSINKKIIGFCGVAAENLEMLFIHPDARGKGIGKALLEHATKDLGVVVYNRSELDSSGKPYPILHMHLIKQAPHLNNI